MVHAWLHSKEKQLLLRKQELGDGLKCKGVLGVRLVESGKGGREELEEKRRHFLQ